MSRLITFTHPTGSHLLNVQAENCIFNQDAGDPSSLEIGIPVSAFNSETSAANPVMLNSTVELTEDAVTLFYGYDFSKEIVTSEGLTELRLSCLDPLGKLKKCAAVLDGQRLWSRTSPSLAITQEELLAVGTLFDFWPVTTSAAWLPIGFENTTTLGANIDDVETTIKAASVAVGFGGLVPTGFIKIDSEWIYYDGYNDDGTDWWFYNCVRGVLGTSAALHLAAATVTQRTSQKVHPGVSITVQRYNTDTSTWDTIAGGDYTVQLEEGFFSFGYDPIPASIEAPYNALRATYGVFDEDHADTVILSDVIIGLLEAATSVGGPGLIAADYDVDIDEIRLTRVRADQPLSCYEAIESLLAAVGLRSGADTDAIGFYYDHSAKKVCVKNIIQKAAGSEDYRYFEAVQIDSDFALEDVFSAIEALYSDVRPVQLASSGCTWFYVNGDTVNGANVTAVVYMDNDAPLLDGWDEDNSTTNHNYKAYKIFDGLMSTGIGMQFDSNPCDGGEILFFFWFGDETTPVSKPVDRIRAVLDPRRLSHAGAPYSVEIVGFSTITLNGASPPTITPTDGVPLGGAASVEFAGGVFLDNRPNVVVEINEVGQVLQGVGVKFKGVSYNAAGTVAYALLKEMRVYGRESGTAFVQITDDTAESGGVNAPLFLYAPSSYAKLVDATFRMHAVQTVDFGAASRNAAISLARLALLNSLVLWNVRTYVVPYIEYVPEIGETVLMPDGYSGVVLGKAIEIADGSARLQLRILDYEAMLI